MAYIVLRSPSLSAWQCRASLAPAGPDTAASRKSLAQRRSILVSLGFVPSWRVLDGTGERADAASLPCKGKNGYDLKTCLRDYRRETGKDSDVDGEILRNRQYEQPGELVTLASGIQYRELADGIGREAKPGSVCDIQYKVYRLSSGAYYKYSSGGTPVLLFSLGYGNEGKDDVNQIYRLSRFRALAWIGLPVTESDGGDWGAASRFKLGDANSLPRAVIPATVGMREGGKRRILVPPSLGWTSSDVGPVPDTFGGRRRLASHKDEPLLFELDLIKVNEVGASSSTNSSTRIDTIKLGVPYSLPRPPTNRSQE